MFNQQLTENSIKRAYIGSPDSFFTKKFVPKLLEFGPLLLIFIRQPPFVLKPQKASLLLRFILNLKKNIRFTSASLIYWKFYSQHHHIPLLVFDSVNNPELKAYLKDKEFILTAGLYEKVNEDLMGSCPNGLINFHYSLLPKYRGCFPIFWQCVQHDFEFGYTFHKMDAHYDSGPILLQKKINTPIEKLNSKNPVAAISDELTLHASNQIYKLISEPRACEIKCRPTRLFTRRDFENFHRLDLKQTGMEWLEKCEISKQFILQDRYLIHLKPAGISSDSTTKMRISGKSILINKDYRNFIIQRINYLPALFYYFQIKKIVYTA